MPDTATHPNPDPSREFNAPAAQANPVLFLTGIFFFNMISRLGVAPLLPGIETDLMLNHTQAGSLFFFISTGYCASLFSSIFLTPRFTHRSLIIFSCFAVGICLLFAAASQGFFMLQLSMLSLGLAGGIYLPSGVASLTALVNQKSWSKVLGVHQLAPNLAYITAPLAAELILSWQTWRTVFAMYGLASLALSLGYFKWGRGIRERTDTPKLKPLKKTIQTPSILIVTFLFVMGMGLNQGVFAVIPLYLNFDRGLAPDFTNHILAVSRIIAFGFPLAGGWFADRVGIRRVMLTILFCSAGGTMLLAILPNNLLWSALIIQASFSVCIFPLCFAVISAVTTAKNRAAAVSVVVPVAHLFGAGLVPLSVGFIAEAGFFDYGFIGLSVMTFLSLPLVCILNPEKTE